MPPRKLTRKRGTARKPVPRCVLCGQIKAAHHPNWPNPADCVGYVAPDPEPVAAGEANTSPGSSARERTPNRRGGLGTQEQRRVKSLFGFSITAIGGGAFEFMGQPQLIPGLAHLLAPDVWTKEDILRTEETALLVEGVYLEMEALFPKTLRWLAEKSESSVHLQFGWALATVLAPRLERRGLIPPGTSAFFALAPISMETGGAPVRGGPDRNGQVDAASVAAAAVVIPDGAANEVRQPDGEGL